MFLNIAMATKSTLYTIAEKKFNRGIFVYLKKTLCPLKMIKTMDAQNTKRCVNITTRDLGMTLFYQIFSKTQCMHIIMKTFTDDASEIIFLCDMDELYNMRTALCDMGAIYDAGAVLCGMGMPCDMQFFLCYMGGL